MLPPNKENLFEHVRVRLSLFANMFVFVATTVRTCSCSRTQMFEHCSCSPGKCSNTVRVRLVNVRTCSCSPRFVREHVRVRQKLRKMFKKGHYCLVAARKRAACSQT